MTVASTVITENGAISLIFCFIFDCTLETIGSITIFCLHSKGYQISNIGSPECNFVIRESSGATSSYLMICRSYIVKQSRKREGFKSVCL